MATRRKVTAERLDREGSSTPTQEDEADILDEVDAESGENGELTVPEDKIREVGAVDAESVRENRRVKTIVGKKRANVPNVSFNTGDVISTYDAILQVWPANSIEIRVRRLTGTAAQYLITSRPRSGTEFYEALRVLHGPHEETEYEIIFVDFSRKEWRGKGKITMPDARPLAQQGQPMYQQYSPPGYAPHVPPGYAPQAPQSHPAYPPQPQPQVPGVPAQPPIVMQAPPGPDMGSMMATMQQMFEMFQTMQRQASPSPSFAPPPQFVMPPPPPPPGSDSNAQMAWMRQAFDMFQSMRPTAAPQQQPQQPLTPPGPAASGPTMAPPPGMMWGWIPGFGFALMPAGGGPGPGMGPPSYRRPPPYQQERESPPYQREREQPPQRERTAAEQFREAMTVVRTAVDAVSDMQTMLPNMGGSGLETPSVSGEDDDSPVKVIDTGKGKFVLDKNNGGFRGWESLYANLPDLLKWAGEQREEIQKANTRQQQQQRPQQLPPGYVEVGPGYQPPPGFVAVPVDSPLPPPPSNMPPPIQPQPPRSWGAPIISEPEEPQ